MVGWKVVTEPECTGSEPQEQKRNEDTFRQFFLTQLITKEQIEW